MSERQLVERLEALADEVESWIEEPDFSWDDAQAGLQKVLDTLRALADDPPHGSADCRPETCGGTHYDPCQSAVLAVAGVVPVGGVSC